MKSQNKVVGFLLSDDLSKVTLIKRDGSYVAVGGPTLNGSETPAEAVYRITFETTGLEILRWVFVGRLRTLDKGQTDYFVHKGSRRLGAELGGEPVEWVDVFDLPKLNVCPNLCWIVQLARLKFMALPPEQAGLFTSG